MKVILLRDVHGCGQAHDIKTVADGYAHNFLFPHKFAEPATQDKIKELEQKRALREAETAQEEMALDTKVQSLHGKEVSIPVRATEKGGLFKTIGASDIARAVREQHSLEMPLAIIHAEPIKTVGEYEVHLESKNQKATLKVKILAA